MATKNIINAHALVWYLEGNSRLGERAKTVLDDPANDLILPIIALAEACWVVQHGKSSIVTAQALLAAVDADPRITVTSLDRAILNKTLNMSIPEMHDRQITATALCLADQGENIAVLTRDSDIRNSGLVPVIW
jgi:PIN domain nuclease of toxin-antitoxin system